MNNTRTRNNLFGHRMTVFRNDHVGDKIVSQGLYEKENLQLLLGLLRNLPQPVVLDIGANIGNHTMAFATVASRVHAFEPIPYIHSLLRQNVEQNALGNVTLHALALSDRDNEAVIHMVTNGNYGASSFDQRNGDTEAVSVQRRRGDALLAELGVGRVDFIKIDVEAHEVFVLRGLMNTLQRDRPVITIEWNDPLTIERMRGSTTVFRCWGLRGTVSCGPASHWLPFVACWPKCSAPAAPCCIPSSQLDCTKTCCSPHWSGLPHQLRAS